MLRDLSRNISALAKAMVENQIYDKLFSKPMTAQFVEPSMRDEIPMSWIE